MTVIATCIVVELRSAVLASDFVSCSHNCNVYSVNVLITLQRNGGFVTTCDTKIKCAKIFQKNEIAAVFYVCIKEKKLPNPEGIEQFLRDI
jgi:hypothetical protein